MPLIIVPTPVGNLEDITLRALRVLRQADLIACEDTRRTRKLLDRYGMSTPMVSCYAHNESKRAAMILEKLREGLTVALVSDAGTPCIADPGMIILQQALLEGVEVDVLPGPVAFVPALLLSGMTPAPFVFEGFLPPKKGARAKRLEELSKFRGRFVVYVPPHDLKGVLVEVSTACPGRQAAVVREISKIHQEAIRGTLEDLAADSRMGTLRGEMVLVVGEPGEEDPGDEWMDEAARLDESGSSMREVVKRITEGYGIPKNSVKRFLLEARREEPDA